VSCLIEIGSPTSILRLSVTQSDIHDDGQSSCVLLLYFLSTWLRLQDTLMQQKCRCREYDVSATRRLKKFTNQCQYGFVCRVRIFAGVMDGNVRSPGAGVEVMM
jgi:hypothetical protein